MDPEITDAVTEWEPVAVGSGYAGLRSLAADEFSGAVTADLAWAFFLNGRIVGVFDGTIEDLSDADLTAYRAPDPSLPLLFAMRELGGETRGQYYTERTPLAEVDRTLSSGSFTGYVELSENVLSGDYYVVYYGGRSMNVAFVGASERLVTGDEAFDLAADEVGIYDVNAVDVTVVDVPGADPSAGTRTDDGDEDGPSVAGVGAIGAGDDQDGSGGTGADGSEDTDATGPDDVAFGDRDESDATVATAGDEPQEYETSEPGGGVGKRDRARDSGPETAASERIGSESTNGTGVGRGDDESAGDTGSAEVADEEPTGLGENIPETEGDERTAGTDEATGDDGTATADGAGVTGTTHAPEAIEDDTVDTVTTEPREESVREDPALDSEETTDDERTGSDAPAAMPADDRSDEERDTERSPSGATADRDGSTTRPTDEDLRTLRERLDATETEREELTAEVAELESQLETARSERDEYRERVAELEAEIEKLRERIGTGTTSETDGPTALSPEAARDGTNLFVRYRSKGNPTLEDARAGDATQETVVENLRIEYHTTFDDEAVTVDGEPYGQFLHATTEWGFVRWVVEDLLYEIGRSGHRADMAGLFDRIPEIDRVQFNGEVAVTVQDGESERHESRAFDLVFRNSMGDPLFVTNVETGRTATTDEAVEHLLEGARAVGTSKETLGAAFFVTTSFFEPEALDVVGAETKSGLLSRNSKTSYVRLSRKQGYHLCLVEARGDGFHMNTPEL